MTEVGYNNIGINLFARERYAEAEPYMRKAYKITSRILGEEHPKTILILKNWKHVKKFLSQQS